MSSQSSPEFLVEEQQIITLARTLAYPATPDVARAVRQREMESPRPRTFPLRRAVALALAVVILCASLWAVPQVRAAIAEWWQMGAVRIFPIQSTPSPIGTPLPTPDLSALGSPMSLTEAQAEVSFPILSSPDLGPPEAVYVHQDHEPAVVSLVWFDAAAPEQIRAMLWHINLPLYASKWIFLDQMQDTQVNGLPAFGLTGPHHVQLLNSTVSPPRLVTNTVLIWTNGPMTYRLEGDFTLEEAVRLAESLE